MPPRGTLLRRPSLQASFNLQKGQQHSLSLALSLSAVLLPSFFFFLYMRFFSFYLLALPHSIHPFFFFYIPHRKGGEARGGVRGEGEINHKFSEANK
jgi:hypothetical protein